MQRLYGGRNAQMHVPDRQRLQLARLVYLKQMRLLITDYCQALLAIGYHVRCCTWSGQERTSSVHAKKAMLWSLSVLMRLSPNETHRTKYIRTLSLALCLWTPWSDITQGCIMSRSPVRRCSALGPEACKPMVAARAMSTTWRCT